MRSLLAFTLLLTGCPYAQAKPITDENNERWTLIECSDDALCFKRAAETCPTGYVKKADPKYLIIRCK